MRHSHDYDDYVDMDLESQQEIREAYELWAREALQLREVETESRQVPPPGFFHSLYF